MHDWFDELDLDPSGTWLRMGTRALGDRPWLLRDEQASEELALKSVLLAERRSEVLLLGDGSEEAGAEVLALVRGETEAPAGVVGEGRVALEQAARLVQEDLVLLRPRDGHWHLDAACVCFPSRWRLADKAGRPLTGVHGPVPGYETGLADRVDRMLDRLTDRPVLRRNWFVHPDGTLFQPDAPAQDPIVPAASALDDLYLRSERQTLRRLPTGWILFTIRVQQSPLGAVLDRAERRDALANYLRDAPSTELTHRGMADGQVTELLAALTGDP